MKVEFEISRAESADEFASARALFEEYAAAIDVDLCFQGFESELKEIATMYGPPSGRLLLATDGGQLAGCVALRTHSDGACEMKRLYVRSSYRGSGLGRQLAAKIIAEAKALGYRSMRLDTLPSMREAIALYRTLGFKEVEAYRYNPVEGTVFMELELD